MRGSHYVIEIKGCWKGRYLPRQVTAKILHIQQCGSYYLISFPYFKRYFNSVELFLSRQHANSRMTHPWTFLCRTIRGCCIIVAQWHFIAGAAVVCRDAGVFPSCFPFAHSSVIHYISIPFRLLVDLFQSRPFIFRRLGSMWIFRPMECQLSAGSSSLPNSASPNYFIVSRTCERPGQMRRARGSMNRRTRGRYLHIPTFAGRTVPRSAAPILLTVQEISIKDRCSL